MKQFISFIICLLTLSFSGESWAQTHNTLTEVIPFRMIDGKIIVKVTVNGTPTEFVLDLAGHNAILADAVDQLHINTQEKSSFGSYYNFVFKDIPVKADVYKINTLTCGNNAFGNDLPVFILPEAPYLKKIGVTGVLSSAIFKNSVLTIDTQHQTLTITQPYRPPYMKLNYRQNFDLITGLGAVCPISIEGVSTPLIIDTWNDGIIQLTEKDFGEWSRTYGKGTPQKISLGYQEATKESESLSFPNVVFVKTPIENVEAVKNPSLKRSVLGKGVLNHGILSIDYIHQKIYFQPFGLVPVPKPETQTLKTAIEDGKLNSITRQYFLEHIFDYRKGEDFIYNGDKPVVIDFWARWCGPCMRLLPQMEKMAEKYKGKVIFYKVNADKEKDLCNYFRVQALPTLFFIPVGGKPIIEVGATPEKFTQIIEEKLLK